LFTQRIGKFQFAYPSDVWGSGANLLLSSGFFNPLKKPIPGKKKLSDHGVFYHRPHFALGSGNLKKKPGVCRKKAMGIDSRYEMRGNQRGGAGPKVGSPGPGGVFIGGAPPSTCKLGPGGGLYFHKFLLWGGRLAKRAEWCRGAARRGATGAGGCLRGAGTRPPNFYTDIRKACKGVQGPKGQMGGVQVCS